LTIVDDYTFELKFAKPYGLFLSTITGWAPGRLMRPSHYLKQFHKKYTDMSKILPIMEEAGYAAEEWGKFYTAYDAAAGSSANTLTTKYPTAIDCPVLYPWILVEEPNPGEFLWERNPYYFKVDPTGKQLPYIDEAHRIFVNDLEVMNAKIVAGETDLQFQFIRLGDFPLFKTNEEKGGYKTMALPAWQDQLLIYFASLTPEDQEYAKIVQDKRFRQAVSLALDRDEIKKSVFLDFGRTAQYAPPKGSDVWEQYMDDAYADYDVEQAKALLDEMGLKWDANEEYRLMPDGRRLSIPFTYYEVTPTATPGAELFPEFMKPIGIDCQIKQVDGRLYWSQNQAGEIHFADWWLPVQYMHIYGPAFFSVTAFGWNTWINTQGESGIEPPADAKRLYELREIMQETGDPAERQRAHKEIWESQAENIWVIGTVAAAPVPFVYNKNLGNISIAEDWGFYSVVVGDAAEQWYWKE
jgi:peptide/nickel transport system substrate-binding protein